MDNSKKWVPKHRVNNMGRLAVTSIAPLQLSKQKWPWPSTDRLWIAGADDLNIQSFRFRRFFCILRAFFGFVHFFQGLLNESDEEFLLGDPTAGALDFQSQVFFELLEQLLTDLDG